MNEEQFLRHWRGERPMYEAWGVFVRNAIEVRLKPLIDPHKVDVFLKVPACPRLKEDGSLVDKAFYRKKQYADPYVDITDKVGVRFVVLLQRQIKLVEEAIETYGDWSASKDRDYEEERAALPLQFDYQSVHYVVRATRDIDADGVTVKTGTPCEIQIRTLLQHAHSELTHNTIYKPRSEATPTMRRTVAKSMALIEATSDFFERVVDDVERSVAESRTVSDDFEKLYIALVKSEPQKSRLEGAILEAFLPVAGVDIPSRLNQFLSAKAFVVDRIKARRATSHLYRQPSIFLVYLLTSEVPTETKSRWPLTDDELHPVFTDLGLNFDGY